MTAGGPRAARPPWVITIAGMAPIPDGEYRLTPLEEPVESTPYRKVRLVQKPPVLEAVHWDGSMPAAMALVKDGVAESISVMEDDQLRLRLHDHSGVLRSWRPGDYLVTTEDYPRRRELYPPEAVAEAFEIEEI